MKFVVDDLIRSRLVTVRTNKDGLRLYKYSKKVFYDALWGTDSRLLQARGIVVDQDDRVVLYPFDKVFNYGENKTGEDIYPHQPVIIVRKVNGYLAQAAMVGGKLVVTSSGSFSGEYAEIAESMIKKCLLNARSPDLSSRATYMFEICHDGDPHIVDEIPGVYLIGLREMDTMKMATEATLDLFAETHNFGRPETQFVDFGQAVELSKRVKHEGFMVRDVQGDQKTLMKIKSKHYLGKKAMMRLGKTQLKVMFENPNAFKKRLDEEFYNVFDEILSKGQEFWQNLDEQARRSFIEEYFDEHNL